MINIEEYILLPLTERQAHLKLFDPCLERGGPNNGGLSSYCKGLMAHILDTTIPSGHKIYICHACNNEKCSNPNHLYWGTAKENWNDGIVSNRIRPNIWENTVAKYGIDKAREMVQNNGREARVRGGKASKGRVLSEEHKKKIADSQRGRKKSGETLERMREAAKRRKLGK